MAAAILGKLRRAFSNKSSLLLSDKKELYQYKIGKWSYGDLKVIDFPNSGTLTVGRYCSFASGCTVLLGGNHIAKNVSTYPFGVFLGGVDRSRHISSNGDVSIGNDVWMGRNVTVLSGVNIGHGSIIGAESLVTSNVQPYSVYGGNPARLIKMRFDESTVARLLAVEWWKWTDDQVRSRATFLLSEDIEGFLQRCERGEWKE